MPDPDASSDLIRLRLLGAVGLTDQRGVEVHELIAQPKRLALLAYLAAAEPTGYKSRDVLLALFWPQQDVTHARAALRRALHRVRHALGPEAIVTRGDDVGVGGAVWCDVAALRVARAAGRWEDVLELYGGELLPGFFVPSAPEFERWMDEERGRLRLAATACARDLATKAQRSGELRRAVEWARRAVALDPDDETAVRSLVGLLDEQGDRAVALQAYAAFARRLREEFGLEPSPETQALAARVKSRSEPLETTSTVPSEAPTLDANLIAVFPFAVRGSEELGYLSDGLVDLLITKLDGAGDLRAVDPRPLLPTPVVAPDAADGLARRVGAGLLVLGSVTVAGRLLHLRASLRHVQTGSQVIAEASGDDERALFELVDELVRQLLARLTASIGGQMARLAARTTTSLPALKAYLRGERAFRTGRYSDAVSAFTEATDHDHDFFLARYRLAAAQAATGRLEDARSAATAAWTGRQRLTSHQRLLLSAQLSWLDGDLETAESAWLRALDERPEEIEGWYHLGHLLFEFNPLRGRSSLEARGPLERTVALDPKHVAALGLLVRLAALERDGERMDALVERLLALSPSAEQALVVRAVHGWSGDRPASRDAVRAALGSAPPRLLIAVLREVGIAANDLSEAEAFAREIARLPTAAPLGALPHLIQAHLAHRRADARSASDALEAAARIELTETLLHRALFTLRSGHAETANERAALEGHLTGLDDERGGGGLHATAWPAARSYLLGLCAVTAGHDAAAEGWAERCAALAAPVVAPELCHNLARGIRAELAWRRGDPVAALEHLKARQTGRGAWLAGVSPLLGAARERGLQALALRELGRLEESARWREGLGQRSPFERVVLQDTPGVTRR